MRTSFSRGLFCLDGIRTVLCAVFTYDFTCEHTPPHPGAPLFTKQSVSARGAAPAWLGEGGGVWILRWPFVVTSPSSLFRLCAMCDLGACPPSRCCRASCNPQHPDDSSGCAYVAPWLWHCPFALRCFRVGARCPRPSPSMPSSLSSPRVVCSVASTTALSALGAAPTWLGSGGGVFGPCD